MGLFGPSRDEMARRQQELEAAKRLSDLRLARIAVSDHERWSVGRDVLETRYSEARARKDSEIARIRMGYLTTPEPVPVLSDFCPAVTPVGLEGHVAALNDVYRQYNASIDGHPERERARLQALQRAKDIYDELLARERTDRLALQMKMWPKHVELDPHVAAIEGADRQVEAHNQKIEERIDALATILKDGIRHSGQETDQSRSDDVAGRVITALETMPVPMDYQRGVRATYSAASKQAVVEFRLPDVDIVPASKSFRYIKNRNAITETTRPASQIKSLYASVIAQLSLLAIARAFLGDTRADIETIAFNGVVDTIDPRSGQPIRPCLITVRVTRDKFQAINLAQVDPQACLKHLSASISRSPTELVPVKPILEFSMADPRFVAATDAISLMDDRPNLMDLTPTEFEGLIQNLFEKMGLDARQTQASRDGGVDCIAYDTRPIFGGKVIIQAKRYKHTVGVSAVRDLFGTLQNEGASKGILVTTSGYGAASFEFAQNKPLELIEGGHLLFLLEEYCGITARIEPPEDWRDPVPDSGA